MEFQRTLPISLAVNNDFDLRIPNTSFKSSVMMPEVAICKKMKSHGYSSYQIDYALRNFSRFANGATGKILSSEIKPAGRIPTLSRIPQSEKKLGIQAIKDSKVAIIKLGGGLGTSMGLKRSKLIIKAHGNDSFLDTFNKQVSSLREEYNCAVPVMMMTSRHTEADVSKGLLHLNDHGIPKTFIQMEEPRLVEGTNLPIQCANKNDEMCPPGHGQIFNELYYSGLLQKLYDSGVEALFLSNGDNLGATLDPRLIGHFFASGAPFMSETTPTTDADVKGGYICRDLQGRLMTCETAQLDKPELVSPKKSLYKHFHINNLYVRTKALLDYMNSHDGYLELSLIVNRKVVDGVPIFQLENAMGSAVHCFDGAIAVEVPRTRFLPVKLTSDLLFLDSDAVSYNSETGALTPLVNAMQIVLDSTYFKSIDDYHQRVLEPVSLKDCTKLEVVGDICFGSGVVFRGDVHLINHTRKQIFLQNQILTGNIVF